MAWRNQGITGSNNIPLGSRRRLGGDEEVQSEDSAAVSTPDAGYKRGRSPVRAEPPVDGVKKRKKRNRWGDAEENKAAGLMGLPTLIMANMTNEQLEAYTLHLRIEEISQKLRINDVVPADGDRSPSPAPQYDNFGRRVNTREYRYRKRLEDERHKLIEKAMKVIPNYHPPSDYRRPTKTQEKVYVPVNDYPEINFIGLLIGPRGNTLKKMETESGAKIAIRGKGSVKEGKGRSDAAHTSNQEEDLHCLIMADTEEKVNKAKKLIHNVIETAASIPEGQNELKRNQLRELAALNGTLRDDENQACQNCGQIGHRKYDCPEQRNFTASIICRVCGNAGHMAKDCPDRQRGTDWRNNGPVQGRRGAGDAVDREMEQLMQELGGAPSDDKPQRRIEAGPGGYEQNDSYGGGERPLKPWERGPTGGPAPWQRPREDRARDEYTPRDHGAAPPWASGGGRYGRGDRGDRGDREQRGSDGYGYGSHGGGYSAPGAAAPWQQQHHAPAPPAVPAAPAAPAAYGYPGYSAFPPQQHMGAPPGLGGVPPPPPGLGAMFPGYGASPPPPPPPADGPPPPPPSDQPPPPPPA
ncbi:branchpoint-bridging protein [Helicocarpus griseus UAMH5409]|uniref:Branchpoint-bridging protein n=1 Tax=Helicocarpus griseus UAMH5409 TaxID=1447875 RepID=A0A2B7YB93_9EURO|nr:branchpoint-bridging protein [Helicocarpus griseus UAMH5409]